MALALLRHSGQAQREPQCSAFCRELTALPAKTVKAPASAGMTHVQQGCGQKHLPLGRDLCANPILGFQIAGQIGREREVDIFLCCLKFLHRDSAARLQVLHHLMH